MKRKPTPKTTTGCQTCRTRRIKCDQRRPSCTHCLRSGWTCPGYTTHNTPCTAPTPRFYYLPPNIPGPARTRQALHHFATTAAPAIGGYFSADFWRRRILQSCIHHAPVRHAVSALADVHREFVSWPMDAVFVASETVVGVYGRAIKALRRYLKDGRVEVGVVMACCAALFCFELVRGELGGAGRHLRCGMSVLRESLLGDNDQSQLVDVFARMDLQASAFENGEFFTMQRASSVEDGEMERESSKTTRQSDSDLGMHDYSMLLQRCFDFLVRRASRRKADHAEMSADTTRSRDRLLTELKAWNKHLDTLSVKAEQESLPQLKSAVARSRLHSSILGILISQSLPPMLPSPGPAPTLDDKADELIKLATEAVDVPSDKETTSSERPSRQFCLHLGVVAPLFLLALKTSRADILTPCLNLLKRCKGRREGWYDADLVAHVIEDLRRQCGEPSEGATLLEQMGDDAAARVQSAVESVVPVKNEALVKARGLSRLLAVAR